MAEKLRLAGSPLGMLPGSPAKNLLYWSQMQKSLVDDQPSKKDYI